MQGIGVKKCPPREAQVSIWICCLPAVPAASAAAQSPANASARGSCGWNAATANATASIKTVQVIASDFQGSELASPGRARFP